MVTLYPAPSPAEFALLQKIPYLQHSNQQADLAEFAAGTIGMETTVYNLLDEVRKRHPTVKAQLALEAEERAIIAREEAEMAANEKADAPTIIAYSRDGKPLAAVGETLPPATATPPIEEPAEESEEDDQDNQESGRVGLGQESLAEDDCDWRGEETFQFEED